ncbi:Putative Ig domain family [Verrucomicrobiia bacterium DG1235]|nr:Putative Ig domain family [Verrucomicrobiae bacterium DG1235]
MSFRFNYSGDSDNKSEYELSHGQSLEFNAGDSLKLTNPDDIADLIPQGHDVLVMTKDGSSYLLKNFLLADSTQLELPDGTNINGVSFSTHQESETSTSEKTGLQAIKLEADGPNGAHVIQSVTILSAISALSQNTSAFDAFSLNSDGSDNPALREHFQSVTLSLLGSNGGSREQEQVAEISAIEQDPTNLNFRQNSDLDAEEADAASNSTSDDEGSETRAVSIDITNTIDTSNVDDLNRLRVTATVINSDGEEIESETIVDSEIETVTVVVEIDEEDAGQQVEVEVVVTDPAEEDKVIDRDELTVVLPDPFNDENVSLTLSNSDVLENEAGYVVGNLDAIGSEDEIEGPFSYSIVADDSALFEIDGSTLKLKNDASIDFENAPGSYTVTIRVENEEGTQIDRAVTLRPADANDAPDITEFSIAGAEDSHIPFERDTFEQAFADVDGDDTLASVRIETLPENGSLLLGSESLVIGQTIDIDDISSVTFQPAENWNGHTDFNWSGFDGTDWSTQSATVSIDVDSVNDTPVATFSVATQTANEDAAFSFEIPSELFADADSADTLTLSAALPAWLTFDPTTGTISGIPSYDYVGSHTVSITATDSKGESVTTSFDLNVDNINDRPTFTPIQAVSIGEYDSIDIDAGSSFSDEDASFGDSIIFSASLADGSDLPDWLTLDEATGRITGTPPQGQDTDLNIRVTATDESAASASTTFSFHVSNQNDAPELVTEIEDATTAEDAPFSFDVSSNFADSDLADTLTYSATLPDGTELPDWIEFDSATGTFSGTPTNDDVGMLAVTVTATDGEKSASDTFAIMVQNTNDGPVASGIANQTASEDLSFSLDVSDSFSDIDAGDALTYSATLTNGSDLPDWLEFDEATGNFYGTPGNEDVGELAILVVASDGQANANAIFSIEVENTNDGPVATFIPDQEATEDAAFLFDASDAFSDIDAGDELTYSATLENGDPLPDWITINRYTGELSGTPENANVGSLSLTVSASDGSASASSTFSIEIENTNDGPVVSTSITDKSLNEDAPFTLDISDNFFDADLGDTLSYSATLENGDPLPSWLSFDSATGEFSGTPANSDVGTISLKVTASDGEVAAETTFQIEVDNENDAPVVWTSLDDQTIDEDAAFSLDLSSNFGDVDFFDTLTFSATLENGDPLPGWLSFNSETGEISGTPENGDIGSLSITVSASDGQQSARDTFTLTVENTNDGPVVTTDIEDQTVAEDSEFVLETIGNFSDADQGDVLTFSAQLADGSELPSWLSIDPETGTLSGTPENGDVGELSLIVTANDGEASTQSGFRITVDNTNDTPTVTAAVDDQSLLEDNAFSLDLSSSFDDVDASDTLSYSATLDDGSDLPSWLSVDPETGILSGTPENSYIGELSLTITASDGEASTSLPVTLKVENTNDQPVVTAATVDQTTSEDSLFTLDTSAAFADVDAGDTLSYSATLADGSDLPNWLSIDTETGELSGTPENRDVGSISVTVTATDEAGATVSDTFGIQIDNTNDGPTATAIADQSATEDSAFSLDVSSNFGDVDFFDELTFSATLENGDPLPDWLTIDNETGVLSGTPGNGDVGELNIIVSANDGIATTTDAFHLTVENTNDGPVVTSDIENQSVNEDDAFTLETIGNFDDADLGDVLTFSATLADGSPLPDWLTIDPETGTLSGTPENNDVGTITVTVIATDPSVSTASDTFNLQVDNTNDGPTVRAIADQTTDEDAPFTLDTSTSFSDVDAGDTLTYSATLENGAPLPSWLTIDSATGELSGTPKNGDVGTITVTVTATDASGSSASDTFGIQVDNTNDGPTATAIANQTTDEDAAFSLDASSSFADVDAGDTLTFSATLENDDPLPDWISIDPATGKLTGTPRNEDVGTLSINVTANDGESTVTSTFTIEIENTNDGPVATEISDQQAKEDSAFNLDISNSFSDIDAGDTLEFEATLSDGSPLPSWLSFDTTSGQFSGTPDTNHVGDIEVKVVATDGEEIAYESFTINIEKTNDNISVTTDIDADTNQIDENDTEGAAVGIVASATDADVGDSITYSVDDARFAVNPDGTVRVANGATFDAETEGSIDIVVTSTSEDGSTSNETFTIAVSDIDEADISATTDTDTAANTIAENATEGTTVGITASATDSDATNSDVTYSVDDARFTVDSNGVVKVESGASFDTETEPSIDIVVTSTSQDGSTSNETFTIAVNDIDEADISATTDTDTDANTIAENTTEGTTVGITASATDSDATNSDVTYTVDDARFTVDANGVVKVASGASFDTETEPSIDIVVTSTSQDGSTSNETFTIAVSDIDEADVSATTDTDTDANTIAENATEGTTVGITASATDSDATNSDVSYSVNDARFTVDANGVVKVAAGASFDTETEPSIDIVVTSTSEDGSTSNETFTIAVSDIDEADVSATTDTDTDANTIAENTTEGTTVGITASATDADATNSDVTYSVDDARFTVDSNGVVKVASGASFDTETEPSIDIVVTSTSQDGSTSNETFTIAVSDIDEADVSATTDTDATANTIAENATEGTTVGITASATDADATNSNVTYSVDDARFTVDANGVVKVASGASFDTETEPSIDIVVTSTSQDGSTSNETFTIAVSDIDEADVSATTDTDTDANTIAENATEGTTVGITASATDADATNSDVSYSVDDARFTVDANGVVKVASGASFDTETEPSIDIVVTSTSQDGSTSNETFTIAVSDIDEADVSATTDTDATANTIAENATEGTTVGITASATDSDATNSDVTYSVDDARFTVDANGVVKVASGASFDTETEPSIDIVVTSTSQDGSSSSETFTIAVSDIDEADVSATTDTDATANTIAENATEGTTVGITASATDADATNSDVSYSVDDARFTVDANGVVKVASGASFDTETEPSIDIVVTSTSQDGSTSNETFTIAVSDIDEADVSATTDTDATANTIAENATEGTTVGITASATDSDATNSDVTYSVDDARFTVDANGVVKVASGASFDTETEPSIDIVVTSTSQDGSSSSETFTIAVSDIDEADVSATTDTDATANTIAENATEGTTVGITASATDADATNSDVSYSVDDARFTVDANGVVKVASGASFDTETEPSIDIVVTSTSQDGSTSNETFTIAVSDIDEADVSATTDTDATANTIAENATEGTTVGITASATDSDATNSDVTYSVDDARFTVDANGVVKVASGASFDTETEPSIDIVVTSTSQDGSSSNETFTIAVSDIDEADVSATTDTDATANTIAENATEGTTVGITASATDADATNSNVTYSVDDARFTVDANGVVKVASGASFDTETEPSIDIVVTSTSQDGSTSNETFTIAVSDIDESDVSATTDTDTAANTIAENATEGTTVGITASATDADATNSDVTYSVDDARFTVDSNGVVKVASGASFDTETEPSIDIVVTSTSQDGSSSSETFTIAVSDIDEADVSATTDTDTDANTIAENTTEGTTVGITASATDADATNSDVTYAVDDARFTVDANGVVKVASGASFDTETEPSIDIVVTSTSQDGSTSNETFTIAVSDIDEADISATTDTDTDANTIAENATEGTTVGITASATDSDATNSDVTYTVDDARFTVDSNGVVKVASGASFDTETEPSIDIVVTSTSQDGSTSNETFTIAVSDIDEADVSATTDTDTAANTIAENATEGTTVGITASATDADATNSDVTYSVDDARFTVDSNGVVKVASGASFDTETEPSIDIVVTSTSQDGSSSSETFTIAVSDIDEADVSATTDTDTDANTIAENTTEGTTVGITASATDADATNSDVTYAVDDARFTVDANGVVKVASGASFDTETEPSIDIVVTSTSQDGSTSNETFSISVSDIDEADVSATADTDTDANTIAENATEGTTVGITASATDADATNSDVTYSVNDARFTVDANGVVKVAAGASFDTETEPSIDIVVTSTSQDGSTSNETFTIAVSDIDESDVSATTDTDTDANTIAENATEGTTVGITASATDSDATNSDVTYAVSDARFTVDANGVVKVASGASFDTETEPSIDIVVTSTSQDGSTSNETFTIAVSDIDEADVSATTDTDTAANTIAENATEGTTVGITASATDSDATNSDVSYSVDDARFTVDANGVVKVASGASFDTETEPSIDIVVTSTSQDGSTSNETFSIAVSDIDEADVSATTDTDASANTIAENATEGTTVGITASATDADATNSDVTYSVNDARFTVDANGVVKVASGASFDTETEPSIDIVVTSTSQDGSTSNETFTIAVSDIDEADVSATTDTDTAANTIAENATEGTTVGITASATDSDATNSDVSYSVDDARFTVDANGVVKVASGASFDTETEPSIDIVVTSTSQDGSTSNETFSIAVSDIDEADVSATTDTDASANTIAENATEGTTVGITASATDADATNSDVTYSVNDARFTVDANGVVKVAAGASFDTETEPSIDIVVTSTSQDGSTSNETFSISVSDIDEADVSATADTDTDANTIAENATEGTTVGITASATDADATNSDVTYSVNDARFTVDANGVVKVAAGASFDTETEPSIDIVVTSTSQDGSTSNETFSISVSDIDEADVSVTTDTDTDANTIAENATEGTTVGITASATDSDATNSDVSYSVNDARFTVDANGVVKVAAGASFDTETEPSIDIVVTSTSQDGSTSNETFSISVSDIDEADVSATADTDTDANTIAENATEGTTVGITASATDADATNSEVSYSVNDARFTVDANGVVKVAAGASFDTETEPSIDIVVTSTSQDGSTSNETFTIAVSDIDEADVSAVSDTDASANTVAENASEGTTVGVAASASDADATDTVSYSVDDARFTVNPNGVVSVASGASFDAETEASIDIVVTATSTDGSTSTETFSIDVSDIDEADVSAAVDTDNTADAISEFASNGSTVGITAFASDSDATNNTVSYSLSNDPSGAFDIDSVTGVVTVADASKINFETASSHTIEITASSTDGSTSVQSFTVNVVDENETPTVTPISDQTIDEDTSFNLDASSYFADVDAGDTLSFSATLQNGSPLPSWLSIDTATGQLSGTPENGDVGSISVTVTATDTAGTTASDTFGIQVDNTNDGPTASAIADQTTNEDAAFSLDASANFADVDAGDTLSFSATLQNGSPLPSWLSIDTATGQLSGTPENGDVGSISVTITATDAAGSTASDTFGIQVDNTNDGPTVTSSISDQSVDELGDLSLDISSNFSDVDAGDTLTFSATLADGSALPDWLAIDPNNGVISGSPPNADGAVYNLTVTASDGTSTTSDNFSITVNDTEPPVGTFLMQDGLVTFEAENYTSNTDRGDDTWDEHSDIDFSGAAGMFMASGATSDEVSAANASNSSELTYDVYFESAGTYYIWMRGDYSVDGGGDASTDDSVHIGVDGVVQTADDGLDLPPGSGGITWTNANQANSLVTITVGSPGHHTINVWQDTDGIALDKFVITDDASYNPSTLNSGLGPDESGTYSSYSPELIAALADQAVDEDATFSMDTSISFSDADGDTLSYSAKLADGSDLPSWLTINSTTGELSGTPTNDDVGEISVVVTASDGAYTASDTFNLAVENTNDAPTVSPIADQSTEENAAFSLDVSSSFADPDAGDTLTFSATLADGSTLPSWLSIDSSTGVLSGTPATADIGTISVKVIASDGATSTNDIFDININDAVDISGDGSSNSLTGTAAAETIAGGAGSDNIDAGAGDDFVYGDDASGMSTTPQSYLINGSFEDVSGGVSTSYGVDKSSVSGWTDANGNNFQMHVGGWEGMQAPTDGSYFLDMGESPGQMDISQSVQGLTSGSAYTLSFDTGDRTGDLSNSMQVYFGGQLIATIDPQAEDVFESYSIEVTGGMGDGSDKLRFVETGTSDNWGISLDNVQLVDAYEDSITGGAGDDTIDGGVGDDIAIYSGARNEYTVIDNSDGTYSVTDSVGGRDGTDTITNIENLQFSDQTQTLSEALTFDQDTTIVGTGSNETIDTGAGNDNVTAGGGTDIIDTGMGDDVVTIGTNTSASTTIDFGDGDDTLDLNLGGYTLDFTNISNAMVKNLENIDIDGVTNDTLKLSTSDVLDMTDENNTLFIDGNTGDTVQIDSSYASQGTETIEGTDYSHYYDTTTDTHLYISSDITDTPTF